MAKKKQRATQTSKGLTHQNPNRLGRKISKEQRREYVASGERMHNQLLAYKRGKNVVVTIPNPNKNETAKPFIKVSGREFFKSVPTR